MRFNAHRAIWVVRAYVRRLVSNDGNAVTVFEIVLARRAEVCTGLSLR